MLAVAYCRVSTEEQAAEGFSIEGQADRLRQYADLHELGTVMTITDPGRSGKDLNRPGLILAGFTRYFAYKRVQALGNADVYFLKSLKKPERERCYAKLFKFKVPCLVFSRNLRPDAELIRAANQAAVPIFRTPLITMKLVNQATLARPACSAARRRRPW